MSAYLENSAVATGLEKVSFHSNPKEGQCQRMLKLPTTALISHASKVTLKILQARVQQYMNRELPDVQAGFRKGRGTRDQVANICWVIEKAREFQKKHPLMLYWLCQSLWLCVSQQTGKSLKRWEYQMTLPVSWEICMQVKKKVRTVHRTTDWLQIGKGVRQGCILSPCLFNFFAECIMWNAGLDEAKLDSRLLGVISVTTDIQMTSPLWQKEKN